MLILVSICPVIAFLGRLQCDDGADQRRYPCLSLFLVQQLVLYPLAV